MISKIVNNSINNLELQLKDKTSKYSNKGSYKECCRQVVMITKNELNLIEITFKDKAYKNIKKQKMYMSASYLCNSYKSAVKFEKITSLYEELFSWDLVIKYIISLFKGLIKSIDELEREYE